MDKLIDPIIEPVASATPLERLKYLLELSHKSQAKFATLINLDPSSMSRILSGKLPITEQFINRVVVNLGVSKDWFARGEGVPFPKNSGPSTIGCGEEIVLSAEPKGAPVYDIEACAGVVPLSSMFTRDKVLGYVDLPEINPKNPIVQVFGDSMMPRIKNGAYLSIRPITDPSIIVWGSIYMVQLEDYTLVKVLKPCPGEPNAVILHSENTAYDDIEVPKSAVLRLFLVETIMNYEIL